MKKTALLTLTFCFLSAKLLAIDIVFNWQPYDEQIDGFELCLGKISREQISSPEMFQYDIVIDLPPDVNTYCLSGDYPGNPKVIYASLVAYRTIEGLTKLRSPYSRELIIYYPPHSPDFQGYQLGMCPETQ